jgi:hypothetical protein
MFWFGKKRSAPPRCQSCPEGGVKARVAFATGDKSWVEQVDVMGVAAGVFNQHGQRVTNQRSWFEHPGSGFVIQPQIIGLQPLDDGGAQTTTTIQVNHPALIPAGLFEYQHSTGKSVTDSISKGFDQWMQTDFVTLLEAQRATPQSCMVLKISYPAKDGKPARKRRAVLGPIAHFAQQPAAPAADSAAEEHPFCPCCLLTRSFEAFRELLEGDGFYGLRLFAARDKEGNAQADCRVNGDDFEAGATALREYAKTWPDMGYEFRKQYVVLQSMENDDEEAV